MPRDYEEPIVTREGKGANEYVKTRHPSYAQIRAGNVSGGAYLYGSDFQHQHYVVVSISRSEMNRNLSNDNPFTREELIEVAMTEAQWASFVSSMNRGSGIPCTLQHINHQPVPQIPGIESPIPKFRADAREDAQEALNSIDDLVKQINESKLSQKQKEEWTKQLSFIRDRTKSNLRFVLQQFAEHMETTVQKARTEIGAMVTHALVRTGLGKLVGDEEAKKFLGYEDRKDKK